MSRRRQGRGRTPRGGGATCRRLVRGCLTPPLAEHLEGVPERRLRRLLVERLVDVGRDEPLDRRREHLELAFGWLELARKREARSVEECERGLAHRDDELGLHDVQLTQ